MGKSLNNAQRRLTALYSELSESNQESLMAFAEFLCEREATALTREPVVKPERVDLPRPTDETVPKALKRLTASYPMLDDVELLHRCSGLMSEHLLQGRAAVDVIDELELLFQQSYELSLQKYNK